MEHLSMFFKAISADPRISTTHIGIYASLLEIWRAYNFVNPIRIFSSEVIPIAKLNSNTTYYRCMRDLHDFGYIRYHPSYKRTQGSQIHFLLRKGQEENDC